MMMLLIHSMTYCAPVVYNEAISLKPRLPMLFKIIQVIPIEVIMSRFTVRDKWRDHHSFQNNATANVYGQ